jgi:putative ABC transport system permease protein
MLRVTWRNLFARKLRLLLSAFAIVLGVAFVAGSLVFTDTIERAFDDIVSGSVSDVTVRFSGSTTDENGGLIPDARSMPASLVDELAGQPGVARADGTVEGVGLFIIDSDGKLVGGQGAPTLAFNYNDAPSITGEPAVTVVEGEEPQGLDEVLLDERTAENAGYGIGDTVRMVTAGTVPELEAELVGIAEFGGGGLAGASLVLFDTPTAQQIFLGGRDVFDSIALTAEPGVSQDELAASAEQVLPGGIEAATGDVVAAETEELVGTVLDFLNIFLLIFAAVALVVGTFLIINTFSILVAQRSRELALLRALGASRRQVTRSVLLEALVIGVVGSTLGLLLGFGLAIALRTLFGNFGLDLSGTPLVFQWTTGVIGYAVGIVVTLIAAYLPARRASRIAPVAAMRDDIALPESSLRRRMIVGVALTLLGAGMMTAGLVGEGNTGASMVGIGVLGVLLGVALMSPVLGRPVLQGLGAAYQAMFGTVGTLARENTLRNPRRTAATASALMIGLALVTTMSVLGASINKSIEVAVQEEFTTDYLVSSPTFQSFSTGIAERIRDIDGVGEVVQQQSLGSNIDGDGSFINAADGGAVAEVYDIPVATGTLDVGRGGIAVSEQKADSLGVDVGDTVTLTFPAGNQEAEVQGIYEQSNILNDALVPLSTLEAAQIPRQDSVVSVNAAEGTSPDELGTALEEVVADLPIVTVQNQEDFTEAQRASVNTLLNLIYALLGLAIIIAVLGIVNTLALSVIERTREVGLLRAVGLSRRQLRRMVRLEAIAIAVLGAVLGIVMGLVFGVVLQQALADQGITDLAVPVWQLVLFVVVAAVVGVLAAVLPARRAAKLDVLKAITTE